MRSWAFAIILIAVLLIVQIWQQFKLKESIMSLADDLAGVKDQLTKASTEITGKIADLEDALANAGEPSAEVTAAVADLKAVAQGLDDIVPDVPAEPVEPPVE